METDHRGGWEDCGAVRGEWWAKKRRDWLAVCSESSRKETLFENFLSRGNFSNMKILKREKKQTQNICFFTGSSVRFSYLATAEAQPKGVVPALGEDPAKRRDHNGHEVGRFCWKAETEPSGQEARCLQRPLPGLFQREEPWTSASDDSADWEGRGRSRSSRW